ncbi:hypothetical protein CIT292_06696 [Citrobacter youngae ATCC 29220]|uniref:Uncharacterized protein n=1 Tax=Citrobacter youngae ATCC 29220 TaxID=500640 RepID=D4B661_9ENTR|nr:hypothetical protein CIT292_06696 [Citrobacter youngae ATCC 29220]
MTYNYASCVRKKQRLDGAAQQSKLAALNMDMSFYYGELANS